MENNKNSGCGCLIFLIIAILVVMFFGSCMSSSTSSSNDTYTPTQSQLDNQAIKDAGQKLDNVIQYETDQGR